METKRPGGEMKSNASSTPTRSQLLPFGDQWQELASKPYFVPGVVVCAAIALLFTFMGDRSATVRVMLYGSIPVGVPMYTIVLALCIVAGGAFAVYRMAGKPKAWWLMPVVAVFTGLLVYSPLMSALQSLFGAAGGLPGKNDGLAESFVKALLRAALPEEILKAIPVLLGAWLGARLMGRLTAGNPARQLAVLEPLDGILIGVASGFGFAFAETVFQYVPRVILDSPATSAGLVQVFNQLGYNIRLPKDTSNLQDIHDLFKLLSEKVGFERASFELAQVLKARQGVGLELMIPRLLSDVFGHAAYAGIFGYFIGLAAMMPAARVKTLLIGLAIPAAIHALWNSASGSLLMYFLLSMAAFLGLAVTIIKARSLSPDRSQLVASQLIDRFVGERPRPAVAPAAAAVTTAPQAHFVRAPGGARAAPAAVPPPGSVTWDDGSLRVIEVGTARVPATLGACLYERQVPGVQSARGDSVVASVSANPNDPSVLGLKNLSTSAWVVTLPGGERRELAPGRSIRIEAGMQLRIGTLTATVR